MPLDISLPDQISTEEVLDLYRANQGSSAGRPNELLAPLRNSHSLVTARRAEKMIGMGNAISDGHLVVYFPHRLVQPALQGQARHRVLQGPWFRAGRRNRADVAPCRP